MEALGMLDRAVRRVHVFHNPVHGPPSWANLSHPHLRFVPHPGHFVLKGAWW